MSATQLANASQMGEPVNPWMMETGSFCIWGALLLLTLILPPMKTRKRC